MIEIIYALIAFGVFVKMFREDSGSPAIDSTKCLVTALFWPVIVGSIILDIKDKAK